MEEESGDFEKFLKDVDEVESIIKDLTSDDEKKQKEAVKASDNFMKNRPCQGNLTIKYDKCLINERKEFSGEQSRKEQSDGILRNIQEDANQRAQRRKENEANSKELKLKGNKEFKAGNYKIAIDYYSRAIGLVKYFPALYTNRAQALIKVEQYDAAIDDCKWALKIDEKCVKAYIHCGRAFQRKKCFSEALSYFKQAQEIDPMKKAIFAEYISKAESEKEKFDEEYKIVTNLEYSSDLKFVKETIEKLEENKDDPKFCIILLRQLQDFVLNDCKKKVVFRVSKGFDCFGKNSKFSRICSNPGFWQFSDQTDFVCAMLTLGKNVIVDNENNCEEILNQNILDIIYTLSRNCDVKKIHLASFKLMHQITEFTYGRESIMDYTLQNKCYVQDLLAFMEKKSLVSKIVIGCLNNLSLNQRFALNYCWQLEEVIFAFLEKSLSANELMDAVIVMELITSCFSTLGNLSRMLEIRKRLQNNVLLWNLCVQYLVRFSYIYCFPV
ncbi:tetratricopeptide repeat protein 12-like [Xenia sp. Carnegie-2017]|uniref:tetratricopeptide repeat protein 12-like n=1 Tax=Xenia sp. Carnegie-2017 TaxID=2897299 RepID=UPI001F03F0A8|nr:tetratricopeptide repeat protein 12-like [Xenia sp. Carnegie-2017]